MQPLAIDLFAGLGGWTDGLLAAGYRVVGFDIERHVYGEDRAKTVEFVGDFAMIEGPGRPGVQPPESSPTTPSVEVPPLAAADRTGKSPAFQFYPDAFLSSTKVQRMSMTERGIYITLLSNCWLDGSLPNDLRKIAGMVQMKPAQLERLWSNVLVECFAVKGERMVNERLERERVKQKAFRQKAKAAADKGWHGRRNADPMPTHSQPTANPKHSVSISISDSVSRKNKNTDGAPAIDVLADRLLKAYPTQGACSLHAVAAALMDTFGAGFDREFDALLERLEGHKRSAKWAEQGGRFIPRLDRYLTSGTHLQTMPSVEESLAATGTRGRVAPGDAWRPEGQ